MSALKPIALELVPAFMMPMMPVPAMPETNGIPHWVNLSVIRPAVLCSSYPNSGWAWRSRRIAICSAENSTTDSGTCIIYSWLLAIHPCGNWPVFVRGTRPFPISRKLNSGRSERPIFQSTKKFYVFTQPRPNADGMLQVPQKKSHSYKWLLTFEVAQRNQFPTNFIRARPTLFIVVTRNFASLLDSDRLSQISWLVHIRPPCQCRVIRQQLQRHHVQDR